MPSRAAKGRPLPAMRKERIIPRDVASTAPIQLGLDDETGSLHRGDRITRGLQLGQPVTFDDAAPCRRVIVIFRIELLRHAPLVGAEAGTRLENTKNLTIHAKQVRSMTG